MPVIMQGDWTQYRDLIVPMLLLICAASVFSLTALLVKHKTLLAGTAILAAIPPFLFSVSASGIVLGAVVLAASLVWLAASAVQKEMENSLRYRIPRFLKSGLGLYFTAAALVISLFYLNRIDEQKAFALFFPQSLFDVTLRTFSGTIQGATGLPPIRPEQTVNEVMTELVRAQLRSQGISFEKIPRQELSRLVASQREEFAKNYGIHLAEGEKIGTAFANAATAKIKDIAGAYNRYLPLVAAVAFFFAFRTIAVVFRLITVGFVMLLMKALVLAKVVKKQKEQIEVERFAL